MPFILEWTYVNKSIVWSTYVVFPNQVEKIKYLPLLTNLCSWKSALKFKYKSIVIWTILIKNWPFYSTFRKYFCCCKRQTNIKISRTIFVIVLYISHFDISVLLYTMKYFNEMCLFHGKHEIIEIYWLYLRN